MAFNLAFKDFGPNVSRSRVDAFNLQGEQRVFHIDALLTLLEGKAEELAFNGCKLPEGPSRRAFLFLARRSAALASQILGTSQCQQARSWKGTSRTWAAQRMERLHSRCKRLLSSRSMSFWMRAYCLRTLPLAPPGGLRRKRFFWSNGRIWWGGGMSMAHPAHQILKPKAYEGIVQKKLRRKGILIPTHR